MLAWCSRLWMAKRQRASRKTPCGRYLEATSTGTSPACQSFATNTTPAGTHERRRSRVMWRRGGVPAGARARAVAVGEAAEGEHERRLARGVAQQREAERVVAVRARRVAVQRAPGAVVAHVVHEHPIDAVFVLVEEAHLLHPAEAAHLRATAKNAISQLLVLLHARYTARRRGKPARGSPATAIRGPQRIGPGTVPDTRHTTPDAHRVTHERGGRRRRALARTPVSKAPTYLAAVSSLK